MSLRQRRPDHSRQNNPPKVARSTWKLSKGREKSAKHLPRSRIFHQPIRFGETIGATAALVDEAGARENSVKSKRDNENTKKNSKGQ